MSCLNPTTAWQDLKVTTKAGKHPIIFSRSQLEASDFAYVPNYETGDVEFLSARYRPLNLPCGKCLLCRKARAWEITIRALLERQAHPDQACCFITLTVDDAHMPDVFPDMKLRHKPWQDFAKRLRKRCGSFRFMMCGEYGEVSKRPHYHAVIFGLDLTDKTWDPITGTFCDSPLLRDIWSNGNIMCRPVNDNAIAYVAGYELKLDGSDDDIKSDDPDVHDRNYVKWSRRPGLGFDFMDQYQLFRNVQQKCDDGFPISVFTPSVIFRGKQVFFDGRYFKRLLERAHDEWTNRDDLLDVPSLPLQWSKDFDILTSSQERRVLTRQLHSLYYADEQRYKSLENRAKLYELQLARKLRDVRPRLNDA